MRSEKVYRVKILDLKYRSDFEHLNFNYFIYEIETDCPEKAIKKARCRYMSGEKPLFAEELPFLLKIFSVAEAKSF